MLYRNKLRASRFIGGLLLVILLASCTLATKYEPTLSSIHQHRSPEWFNDAKFGIFIHWGLYSVPAYAPTEGEIHSIDPNIRMSVNPYAEWYRNTMKFEGSPTDKYHKQHYGADFDYYDFAPIFDEAVKKWNPDVMADIFADAGAQYVVLTTKHHDGFTLWPSKVPHPEFSAEKINCTRDIVGDLTNAVRKKGMKMGLYYSGGIDWSFDNTRFALGDRDMSTLRAEPYSSYLKAQYLELIDRYKPSVLWNDITYPRKKESIEVIAYYYNHVPEGVVNDRWGIKFRDFTTPEYAKYDKIVREKWESCRGIGYSFGYNAMETDEHMPTEDELIEMLIDIVSKNGNLLLNVGPKADGSISELQLRRLRAIGQWLKVNGQAIYETKPWKIPEAKTQDGTEIRFTRKDNALYAILFDKPDTKTVTISEMTFAKGAKVQLLGAKGNLKWQQQGNDITITLPETIPGRYAWCLEIKPLPKK